MLLGWDGGQNTSAINFATMSYKINYYPRQEKEDTDQMII